MDAPLQETTILRTGLVWSEATIAFDTVYYLHEQAAFEFYNGKCYVLTSLVSR